MRSSNPVFSREGSFTRDTGYAGFGTTQQPPAGAPHPAGPNGGGPYGGNPYGNNPYAQPQGASLTDEQLVELYQAPSAGPLQTGRMTMDDVVARTALTLLTLVATGAVAWFTLPAENYAFAVVSALAA